MYKSPFEGFSQPCHLLQKYTSALVSVCRTGIHVHAFDFPLSVCVYVCVRTCVCVFLAVYLCSLVGAK